MQIFGKFDLLELFHFRFVRPLPWVFGRGRPLEYVCKIWENRFKGTKVMRLGSFTKLLMLKIPIKTI